MDTPAFRQPSHGYGQPFGTSPDTSDEDWAGKGYDETPGPAVLEPVDAAA